MNSYLYLDHSGKTLKRISRSIIRRLAVSFSVSINSRLDYIGMGSLFYEDFKEFYPSGCIDSMISIECMTDAEGNFDDIKYRRFMLNRPYEQIRIMPVTVSKAVAQIPFDKPFLIWLDYDCTISRETIEDIAEVIRRASAPGMLVSSTGAQIASKYIAERHTLDMENIRYAFTDMLTAETATTLDDITWDSFTERIRDAATPYYQNVVSEKNAAESRNYRLFKAGRVEHRQPSRFVTDIWLLTDADETDTESVSSQVLETGDAGYHCIDMVVLTERERQIIGSRLDEAPELLAEELSIDSDSVRKYIRYWGDFAKKTK